MNINDIIQKVVNKVVTIGMIWVVLFGITFFLGFNIGWWLLGIAAGISILLEM